MSEDQAATKIQARWKGRNARRQAKIDKIKRRSEAREAARVPTQFNFTED